MTCTQIAVRLRNPPEGRNQQTEGKIRDLIVQNVRRIGDHDAAPRRVGHVHVVIADPIGGDDLKVRQVVHQGCVSASAAGARGDALDQRPDFLQARIGIRGIPETMQRHVRIECFHDALRHRLGHEDVGHGEVYLLVGSFRRSRQRLP